MGSSIIKLAIPRLTYTSVAEGAILITLLSYVYLPVSLCV